MSMKDGTGFPDNDEQISHDSRIPWPDVDFIFGEDQNYQLIVSKIMKTVTKSLSYLTRYTENYKQYCEMIDSIIRLNLSRAFKLKTFIPNDYYLLLLKHTEFLNNMNSMIVDRRIGIFKFRAHEFQTESFPYPSDVIKMIDSHMPPIAIRRNEKLQETMRVNIS